jgi:hypothetical protein
VTTTASKTLDPALKARLRRLRQEFEYFAPEVLRVKPKKPGPLVPFQLNRAQRYVHRRLEQQLALKGRVRAIILKMRQGGISTYIEGRYYHRTSMREGFKAFILTHETKASDTLFDMAQRYYDNAPKEMRPHLGACNAKELVFDFLGSEYAIATAGTAGAGRSQAAQLFHGSEVAFWKNAKDHMAGIGQIIPDERGTEMILESTANGMGNWFHKAWQDAEAGLSEYEAIFIPWFWADEYAREVPQEYRFSDADREYQSLHKITNEQLYWRRRKIIDDFQGDELLFQQEYPATAVEAFIASTDSYISPLDILRARKATAPAGPVLLMGVDPSRFGDDRTIIIWRRGRKVERIDKLYDRQTMELAGVVANHIRESRPTKLFIDKVGLGVGIYDRLLELGYGDIVVGVEAGAKATDAPTKEGSRYTNKKAEMWGCMKLWLQDSPVQIPDVDEVQADITAPHFTYDSNQRLVIESKEAMRKRGVKSTDIADALGLTFAYPVSSDGAAHGAPSHEAPRRIRRREVSWQAR